MRANIVVTLNISVCYIAGTADGIVTTAGSPASRHIVVFDVGALLLLTHVTSLSNGHYLIGNLDAAKQYLVMVRDLPPTGTEQRYEPYCYDYVTPATDLTVAEQQTLWASWQT